MPLKIYIYCAIMAAIIYYFGNALMSNNSSFLLKGLTQKHKDFLKTYAQKNLGSHSRTKAIIAIIDKMMENELIIQERDSELSNLRKDAIYKRNLYISQHEDRIKENNKAINIAKKDKNHVLAAELSRKKFSIKRQRIQFSLPVYDYEFLQKLATLNHSSIQYYISTVLYNHLYHDRKLFGVEIEQLKKSNYELHKIGVNVNQIAKANNAGDMVELPINKLHEFIKTHVGHVQGILKNSTGIY